MPVDTKTGNFGTVDHLCRWDKDECLDCPLADVCNARNGLPNGGGLIASLKAPTIADDGFAVKHIDLIKADDFQEVAKRTYETFEVGQHSKNKLKRGIAWGTLVNGQYHWHNRDTYQLSSDFNSEEGGQVRTFVKSGLDFLNHPVLIAALNNVFEEWGFPTSSFERAYEVQLGQIRYEPTIIETALPSPLFPHQDEIDGAIIVLSKEGDLVGGRSRLYTLDDQPLYELDLDVGDALFVRDAKLKHQVTPMMLEPTKKWTIGDRAYRDVVLVRFQPIGRFASD